jgi:hypothetical protein
MSQIQNYYLQGLSLRVNDSAYLVEIELNISKNAKKISESDLPEWIFRSRHAIWLTVESGSIHDRAKHGDQIREKLMKARTYKRSKVQKY